MDNPIVNAALSELSAEEQHRQIQKAKLLIAKIADCQAAIEDAQVAMAEYRDELKALSFKPKTAAELLG